MNKSTSWAALGQAYLSPITHVGAVLRIFWPMLALVTALGIFHFSYFFKVIANLKAGATPTATGYFLPLAAVMVLALFSFSLLASGLVRWHRFLVLGEPARTLALLPRGRDLKYVLRWLVIGILTMLIYLGLSLIISPLLLLFVTNLSSTLTDPVQALPSILGVQTVFAVVLMTAGTILSALLLARKYLFLPLVSVETPELAAAAKEHWRRPKDAGFIWGITLAIVPLVVLPQILTVALMINFLPAVLAARPGPEAMVQLMSSPPMVAINVLSGILGIYALLVMAGFLSHYYRDRIRPTLEADIANAQQGQDFT